MSRLRDEIEALERESAALAAMTPEQWIAAGRPTLSDAASSTLLRERARNSRRGRRRGRAGTS